MNNYIKSKIKVTTAVSGSTRTWGFSVTGDGMSYSRQGCAPGETANALEIMAVTEGLRQLPDGTGVIISTGLDYVRYATLALISNGKAGYKKWYKAFLRGEALNQDLWRSLQLQLARLKIEVERSTGKERTACKTMAESVRDPSPHPIPVSAFNARSWSASLNRGTAGYSFTMPAVSISTEIQFGQDASAAAVIGDTPDHLDEALW